MVEETVILPGSTLLRRAAVVVAVFLAMSCRDAGAEPEIDLAVPNGIMVDTLLKADDAATGKLSSQTVFDIDPNGVPFFADGTAIRQIGSKRELLTLGVLNIDDFAWMRNGSLLLVARGHLASVAPTGLELGPKLPGPGMHIRPAGADTTYVFGGSAAPQNHDVYLLDRNGKSAKLASLPLPVAAVAGDGTVTYVASGTTVLRIALNKRVRAVLETQDPVMSLEIAPNDGLFYSTKSGIGFLDRNGEAVEFIRGDGGVLRVRGSMLFVLLSSGNVLRLGPVEKFATSLGLSGGKPVSELPAGSDGEPVGDLKLLQEIKDRLYELNFDVGASEKSMHRAIRKFEAANKLAQTGVPTYGLLRTLRQNKPLGPWGAIIYARASQRWGMSWDHDTRKQAVSKARMQCGDAVQCNAEVSFFGTRCGAFAHSSTGWSLVTRSDVKKARTAALAECRKRGKTCTIIAAICADGSGSSNSGQPK